MPDAEDRNVSGKIRASTIDKAKTLAERLESTNVEVIAASVEFFDRAPEQKQRREILKVRRVHPMPYPRTGRGNRKVVV